MREDRMAVFAWLRALPVRTKAFITVAGAAIAFLGGSTYLSFRYWRAEALLAAEQQALLAANSVRAAVEAALSYGSPAQARSTLHRLVDSSPATSARVYSRDGTVIYSSDPTEEGSRTPRIWVPDVAEVPTDGLVQSAADEDLVRAFLPITSGRGGTLQVAFSVAHVRAAMDRGAKLGIGLMVGAGVVMTVVMLGMLEKEVIGPIQKMDELLTRERGPPPAENGASSDQMERIQASVEDLIAREVEAERRFEEQETLIHAQSGLAQVGELAAEMAHEFKRPLASISTALELLGQSYVIDESGGEVMEQVNEQIARLSDTMQDLFSLAKPVTIERERTDPSDLLDDCLLEAAGHTGAESVEFTQDYPRDLPAVWVERRRLQQAFVNILVNGLEALPRGGEMRVSARPLADVSVLFEFQDHGQGMPESEVEKAFKPFYSTKPLGTGLGLPLVIRVVRAHKGRIGIETARGEGTTVRVCIPVFDPDASEPKEEECGAREFSSSTTIA
jgi:signal transduction histidine kinase